MSGAWVSWRGHYFYEPNFPNLTMTQAEYEHYARLAYNNYSTTTLRVTTYNNATYASTTINITNKPTHTQDDKQPAPDHQYHERGRPLVGQPGRRVNRQLHHRPRSCLRG